MTDGGGDVDVELTNSPAQSDYSHQQSSHNGNNNQQIITFIEQSNDDLSPIISLESPASVNNKNNGNGNIEPAMIQQTLCKCQYCPVHNINNNNPNPTITTATNINSPSSNTTTSTAAAAITPNKIPYIKKFRGQKQKLHKYLTLREMFWAFIGSFLGIAFPAILTYECILRYDSRDTDLTLIIGSFGASAVLLYSSIVSDFAQPRSVIGGHIISAFIGVCIRKMFPVDIHTQWLVCSLAVSLAIVAMNLTRTLHPPGGATALIAVLPSPTIQNLGFLYIVIPVGGGILCMIIVALIINNISKNRHWPKWWY